jgi:queuine tRNA-ribosyltransferase
MPNRKELHTLGNYEVHRAWEGFASIRQISSGEIMHSRTPPMEEARKLYIEQSDLAERLRCSESEKPESTAPLLIWDVGLGAAANAMAAILCYEEQAINGPVRPLRIVSFENDLDSLRLAFRHRRDFPYLCHSGPAGILKDGAWQSPQYAGLSWLLLPGDFLETMATAPAPPDLIYYDMFSTKTSGDQWTLDAFRKVFAVCAGHAAELFTYTCSTANRAALLAAGFYVARGRNAGEKLETTIALTPAAYHASSSRRRELLTPDWLEKWNRSAAKFPDEIPADQHASFEQLIRGHAQFRESWTSRLYRDGS